MFSQGPNTFSYEPQMATIVLNEALVDKAALKKASAGCEVKWFRVILKNAKPTSFSRFLPPGIFFSFPNHKIQPSLLFVTVLPLMDRDSIAAIVVAGPPIIQYKIKDMLDWVMCNEKILSVLQSHGVATQPWSDKMKGGNEDLRKKAISPRSQSSMAAEIAKDTTPSGTLFNSCCGGQYVASCSGKICLFPLQFHLLLHCSFSCPVEGKKKLGEKQVMLGLDLGPLMTKAVR